MPHTYILRCNDGSYYVGSTWDIDLRVWQHNNEGGAAYTRHRQPVVLVWNAEFDSIAEAFAFEKRVLGWSRAKREALIRGDFDHLPDLSRRPSVRARGRRSSQ
ncbi:GIY-YIG nuclease family protein [Nocardioides psychrotolerans]|uniref:GIY-YIG nuclease family protein n=1 Tax=Nocardioides psychrotolerans TaxID=1005945 RepID=UPI003137CE8B